MKQQIRIWGTRVAIVVLVVLGVQRWGTPMYKQYFAPKKTEVFIPTTVAKAGPFTISFQELGTLEAEKSVAVVSEINGKIISLVDDGTVVSTGDVIAVLDTTELEREIYTKTLEKKNADADVDRAKAELELLKESNKTDLAQAQAQLDFDKNELQLAKDDLEKKRRLLAEKLVTGEQVKQAEGTVRSRELAVEKGQAQLELKLKEIESKEKQKEAEIRNVEFRARMVDQNLKRQEAFMQKATLRAPSSGLVVLDTDWTPEGRRKIQEGDNVRPEQTLCSLPDLSNMRVKVQVGEADAPRVRLDMPVLIRLEAVPNKVFHGRVKDISSLATQASPWEGGTPGKKNFEVKIGVQENDPKVIKPGMTANCEFIVDRIAKAVYIPIECVIEDHGKTYVYVKEGKRFRKVEVKTGKYNDNNIVITRGLAKGQAVALRDPTRELDQQEAGSAAPGLEKKQKKEAAPIPEANSKK